MDDGELLKRYVAAGSEEAFRLLVERNVPLVFSAALRKTGNRSMAEDVTQVVFIILAKKAPRLSKGTVLAGWLHRTTHYISTKALLKEYRRRQREQKAVQMQTEDDEKDWESLAPVLDDALAELGEAERGAVLMRYFQNRSFREVGKVLGVSDDTAQKKVSRSLDKLRRFLFRRGVAISLTTFTGLAATRAAQFAPETLAGRVVPAALKDSDVSNSVHTLLQEALRPELTVKTVAGWTAAAAVGVAIAMWAAMVPARPSVPSSRRVEQRPAPAHNESRAQSAPTSTPARTSNAPAQATITQPPVKPQPDPPGAVPKVVVAQPVVPKTNNPAVAINLNPVPKDFGTAAQNMSPSATPLVSNPLRQDDVATGNGNDLSTPLQVRPFYGIEFHGIATSAPPRRVQILGQPTSNSGRVKKRIQ